MRLLIEGSLDLRLHARQAFSCPDEVVVMGEAFTGYG